MDQISFEDFKKTDLRVGKILSAERVDGSEKLLKLSVDIGEKAVQILAGIGKKYSPEELVGKIIIVVANLAPRKMMGEESNGMLLAADGREGPILLMPDGDVAPGAEIR